MCYIAEAFLLGEGLSFSKHSAVIAAFGQHFVKTGRVPKEFHRYLIEGENSRNIGDYDIAPGLNKEEALKQLEHADRFIDLAGRLIVNAPPQSGNQS